jgi:CBS domain-containing protein
MKLRELVDRHVLAAGERSFLVMDDDIPRGIITLRDVTGVAQDRWDWTSVFDAMKPWASLTTVTPDTDLMDALRLMDEAHVAQLPVIDGDKVLGLLTREEIIHYIRLRMELEGRQRA